MSLNENEIEQIIWNYNQLRNIVRLDSTDGKGTKQKLEYVESIITRELPELVKKVAPPNIYELMADFRAEYEKFKDFIINVKPDNYEICYITGKSLYDKFMANFQVPDNVKVFPFMDELPGLIKCSDAVISRAGAGSLSEILVLKAPALIIPSPYVANNHQYYNAKEFSDKGLVLFMNESDITNAKLKENIDNLLFSTETRYNLINNMEKESTLNSANYIYKSIKEIINN